MKTKIILFVFRALVALSKFAILNALRATIIILAYLFRFMGELSDGGLILSTWGAKKLNINIRLGDDISDEKFEAKYTDDEIDRIAIKTPAHIKTIGEIQEYHDLTSYRQARKVKKAIENRITINHSPGYTPA